MEAKKLTDVATSSRCDTNLFLAVHVCLDFARGTRDTRRDSVAAFEAFVEDFLELDADVYPDCDHNG